MIKQEKIVDALVILIDEHANPIQLFEQILFESLSLRERQVLDIIRRNQEPHLSSEISDELGISRSHVCNILSKLRGLGIIASRETVRYGNFVEYEWSYKPKWVVSDVD